MEWLSLTIAVAAMAVAGMTYLDQRDVNSITEARNERRYADRVAWWTEGSSTILHGPNETVLMLQNRTPTPVRGVVIEISLITAGESGVKPTSERSGISGPDVPPCKILRVPLRTRGDDTFFIPRAVHFVDSEGRGWRRDDNGALSAEDPPDASFTADGPVFTKIWGFVAAGESPAEDCTDA
ncbi:hypothetical protein [Actinoplanes missouriensis]|uniref:hypothetical protein n=1 Tax=Actinoplanes missouriensis TaxID=1866 RepID=UPI0005A2B066